MTLEYIDLVHDEQEAQALLDNCPHIDESLGDCDKFYLDKYLMNERPWFMPGVNILQLGGFNTIITYRLNTDQLKSWEDVIRFVADLTEKLDLKRYLVFKVCSGCGIELPVIDYRIREDGLCTFCGGKEKETTQDTHEVRSEVE